ncbi:hypothetical protein Har1131_20920 [Haloarcula sp. CBA1131]|uniref:hypothetical protein n=1 Tax=Haloarcula sp. CBA1131 TaxID=1853686 RepID=UPI0012491064|nr:hypothetical protein [Haloarcula sp. CBA1131]KAA9401066.1 hypothetical protein Har1131_20920 [Haloarcula sp. CBA1131]
MCCPDCRRPRSASACVDKRYYVDGQAHDPIPWGEGSQYLTYKLQVLQTNERAVTVDLERWRDQSCPACGVEHGEVHHRFCDYEECPACGELLLLCSCVVEIEVVAPRSPRLRIKQSLARLV